MKDPQISWYIKENEVVTFIDREIYMGSYNSSNIEAVFNVQLWYNKWGDEDVKNLENFSIAISFDTIEDNALLNRCEVKVDKGGYQKLDIVGSKGIVKVDRVISGMRNSGNLNANNYLDLSIRISPITGDMKNGLKNIVIDLQYDI